MLAERKLALVLFASLGLNIFLGGVLGGKLLSSREEPEPAAEGALDLGVPPHASKKERPPRPKDARKAPPERDATAHRRDAESRRRNGASGSHAEGPSDLALLRQMIRIMGGPKDPRISQLRDERRDELQRIRTEMQLAHKRVHEALTSEESSENELHEALKNLRKTAFESQARAQEGILTLAKLMTPEERAELRGRDPKSQAPQGAPEATP